MTKLISNQISPNLKMNDFFIGLLGLFSRKEIDFSSYFGTSNYQLYNAARTGIGHLINLLNIPKDKKIAIPAFTCAVTATPFLESGYTIEWIDVDSQGLIDFSDFKKKADKTDIGLVLCIHTFGQILELSPFQQFCNKKNIFILEDCAHYLPNVHPNTFKSDARLYSFGREKVISCISGGALIWNKQSFSFTPKLLIDPRYPTPTILSTLRLLLHPFIYSLALPVWYIGGKFIPAIAQKLKILPPIITNKEKNGKEDYPKQSLHPSFQKILKQQFEQYPKTEIHRKSIARHWQLILAQKFPYKNIHIPQNAFRIIVTNLNSNKKIKHQKSFHLQEWNGKPIAPQSINLSRFQYKQGQCPNAEYFTSHYLTFPTNIRTKHSDLKRFEKILEFNEN